MEELLKSYGPWLLFGVLMFFMMRRGGGCCGGGNNEHKIEDSRTPKKPQEE
ncbi:MAG: hypothetical protein PHU36_00075 [Syntrophomonadaceae bacterium]|nr:hypothetical protein [Syntrophomonadaceae bacterium]